MALFSIPSQSDNFAMSEELVVATTPAARVRVLAFNRPAKRNALSQKLITAFLEHLQEESRDNGV